MHTVTFEVQLFIIELSLGSLSVIDELTINTNGLTA